MWRGDTTRLLIDAGRFAAVGLSSPDPSGLSMKGIPAPSQMPGGGGYGGDGHSHWTEKRNRMGDRIKVTDPEKLTLLYERFRDVCLVEKEVWKEIFMPREVTQGPVRTNVQDRYDVEINDPVIEDTLEANIPRGSQALAAAIQEYRANISFYRKA